MLCENESIYNLIPPPTIDPPRQKRYKSKHPGKIDPKDFEMGVNMQRTVATMGHPNGCNVNATSAYLRSHSKEPILPEPTAPTIKKTKLKDPIPSQAERPVMGLVSNKNFITTNAVEAILSQPKQNPAPEFWTQKKGYGKTPKYLATAKDTIKKEKEAVEAYRKMKEQEEMPSSLTQMDDSERTQLLAHLKTKWNSVNTAYQKMTFTLDTPAKQKRKEGYEKQLVEIERDIQMLERGDVVLIIDE